jgi:hypothetical protein
MIGLVIGPADHVPSQRKLAAFRRRATTGRSRLNRADRAAGGG